LIAELHMQSEAFIPGKVATSSPALACALGEYGKLRAAMAD